MANQNAEPRPPATVPFILNTSSKQNQEKLGALAYRIIESDAHGGIIVTSIGLQKGAKKVADAEYIFNVILDADSTVNEFYMKFLHKIFFGLKLSQGLDINYSAEIIRSCYLCGTRFPVQFDERECIKCKPIL